MRCEHCGAEVSSEDRFCPRCGRRVEAGGDILDEVNGELAEMEAELDSYLEQAVGPLDVEVDPDAREDQPRRAKPRAARAELVHQQEWLALLDVPPEQVRQSANFVFDSPSIQGNSQYAERVARIDFVYTPDHDEVNAFATDDPAALPPDVSATVPAVVYRAGLARAIRVVSLALAGHLRASRGQSSDAEPAVLVQTFREVGAEIVRLEGGFPRESAGRICRDVVAPLLPDDASAHLSRARSCSAAMDMYVVAHEAGHVALGHTLSDALNYDMSRNQEREADSFAATALSTCPFSQYMFLGHALVAAVFAWTDHAAALAEESTHPLGRERFANALTCNREAAREAAEEFGLTRERLRRMLPPEER